LWWWWVVVVVGGWVCKPSLVLSFGFGQAEQYWTPWVHLKKNIIKLSLAEMFPSMKK
jgi:hypothetical protein